LLGRIVVAEDLDAAVAMAKQYGYRFRIVTLDGQVVNAGGSMTGGSMAKNAGLLSRQAQIQQARQQAQHWTVQEEEAAQRLKVLQDGVSADEAALIQLQSRKVTLQEEDIRGRSESSRLHSLQENLRQNVERLNTQQETAARRLEELNTLRKQAAQKKETAEAQKQTVEQQLERLSMEKSLLQAQRDVAAARISEKRMELLGVEKDVQQLGQSIEELDRRTGDEDARRIERTTEQTTLERQIQETEQLMAQRAAQAEALVRSAEALQAENQQRMQLRIRLEQKQAELRNTVRTENAQLENLARELARLEEQRDTRQQEYDALQSRLWEEYELTPREARACAVPMEHPQQAQRRLNELKSRIKALGSVNVGAIEEYREVHERYTFLKTQLDDVGKARKELLQLIDRLTGEMKKRFLERFQAINAAFGETFRALFGGGSAGLSLANPSDVLESSIEITIQPQGKIITNIEALSGGEKSLAAIALYFAIMKVSPTPFCIMDEIEAALDDANVTRFASYLRRMSPTTQYIAITHRRGTMEEADVLYGVTMQEKGVSKLLRLPVSEVEARLGVH
jgi:chromosome segregation protein